MSLAQMLSFCAMFMHWNRKLGGMEQGPHKTSLSRLEKLPAELKAEICSYLDYKSVLNLTMTSRRL